MAEKNEGKESPFYLSIPFLIFLAAALLIAALQLSISNKVDASPTGFASIITVKEVAESGQFFDEKGKLRVDYINQINQNLDGVPEYLFKLFGSDNINIYVGLNDGSTSTFNVTTQSNKIVQLSKGTNPEANIKIELGEQVIQDILDSDAPLDEFLNAFNSGKIKYSGAGIEGKVKETGVGVTVGIIGLINGIISFLLSIFGR